MATLWTGSPEPACCQVAPPSVVLNTPLQLVGTKAVFGSCGSMASEPSHMSPGRLELTDVHVVPRSGLRTISTLPRIPYSDPSGWSRRNRTSAAVSPALTRVQVFPPSALVEMPLVYVPTGVPLTRPRANL